MIGAHTNTEPTKKADVSASGDAELKNGVTATPSIGEKWWHRITYTGIGYGANLVVSIALWDSLLSGRARPLFDAVAKTVEKGLLAGGMENAKAANLAFTGTKMACSPLGGHFTMVPVKIFEDHARYITHRLNQALDPNYKYKDLKADWNTPEDQLPGLANEPNRNSWGQVAIRRGLGWAAVIGSGIALNKSGFEKPLESWTVNTVNKGVAMTGSTALKNFAERDVSKRWIELTALDLYFTAVTSAITSFTKNTFGKKRGSDTADDALSVDIPGVTVSEQEDVFLGRPVVPPNDTAATIQRPKPQPKAAEFKKPEGTYQDKILADKQNSARAEQHI